MPYVFSNDESEIYYEIEGSDHIALCWVYGAGGFIEAWIMQRPLAERYKMIYIDLAGHGRSKTNRTKFTMKSFGEDVSAVIEKNDLVNVILIGWSMGGPVIQEAAELLDTRVIGLIGVDTFFPYYPLYQGMEIYDAKRVADEFRGNTTGKIKNMYNDIYNNQGEKVDLEVQKALNRATFPNEHVFLSELEELALFDVRPMLLRSKIPVKAIISGLNVPLKYRPSFKEYSVDAVFMDGHGHGLHLSGSQLFNHHLENMVEDIVKSH